MEVSLSYTQDNTSLFNIISEVDTKGLQTKLNNNKLLLKNWGNKNKTIFKILKYDKEFLVKDSDSGKFRSVIFNTDNKLVCYAPPKSVSVEKFMGNNKGQEVWLEEFVEGTMINMFYDTQNSQWEMATRTSVGGNVHFFNDETNKKTFYDMFTEVCQHIQFTNYEKMNKDYCYSFVLKHPDNRIVGEVSDKELYLVGVYKCNTGDDNTYSYTYINKEDEIVNLSCDKIKTPAIYTSGTLNDDLLNKAKEYYANHNTPYYIMGIVIRNSNGDRCKIRNPNYEMVRKLRGNQPKLQYQYFVLRNANKVKEYLKYYRENTKKFEIYRDQLHNFTSGLFQNYISCYIKKEKPLNNFPEQYRTHMYKLHHEIYLIQLKENKKFVNFEVVKNYVNSLHPSQQMYSVNYSKYYNKKEYKFNGNSDKETTPTDEVLETTENNVPTEQEQCN